MRKGSYGAVISVLLYDVISVVLHTGIYPQYRGTMGRRSRVANSEMLQSEIGRSTLPRLLAF